MKSPLHWACAALLALVAVHAMLQYRWDRASLEAEGQIAQLQAARLEVSALMRTYADVETAQRNFLLTSDPRYLVLYDNASETIARKYAAIRSNFASSKTLSESCERLSGLGDRKRIELENTLIAFKNGEHEAAMDLILGGQGRSLIDEMHKLGDQIDAQFAGQAQQWQGKMKHLHLISWTANCGFAGIIAVTLLTLSLGATQRQQEREKHLQILRKTSDQLSKSGGANPTAPNDKPAPMS